MKVLVTTLPEGSEAVQVTVVVPMGNVEPDGGVQVTTGFGRAGSLSVAEAVKFTTAPDGPVGSTLIGAGSVSTGATSSLTVTVNVPVDLLPLKSVDVQVTVVVPIGNVEPDGGVQVTAGWGLDGSSSVAATS